MTSPNSPMNHGLVWIHCPLKQLRIQDQPRPIPKPAMAPRTGFSLLGIVGIQSPSENCSLSV